MIDGKREGERKIWTRDEVVMQKGFRRSMKRKAKKNVGAEQWFVLEILVW